jgi:predicted ester cyclase
MTAMATITDIRAVVESFYGDIWNRYDKSKIPALLCENFTFRGSLGQAKVGHNGFASYVDFVHKTLGDYCCEILDLVIEGDKAFARMRFSGIHHGHFLGYQPTGKPVEWLGSALFSFNGKKVADIWVLGDIHGLLQLLERNANG